MAYTVDYTDPSKSPIMVNDGTVDTTTDIKLIGKNYTRYGEIVAEDFLHLLENFAASTAPSRPSEGQLWYDSGVNQLKYFDDTIGNSGNWKSIASMTVTNEAPNGDGETDGHFWLDNDNGQLAVYYNGSWQTVSSDTGDTAFVSRTRLDSSNISHNTLEMVVNNKIVSIISSDNLDWIPNSIGNTAEYAEDGSTVLVSEFPLIKQGINVNTSANYLVNGTSTSSQYADLAERYASDEPMGFGTVVCLGGEAEVTKSTIDKSDNVFGVVSTNPGYMLNSMAGNDTTHPYIALAGRVPCLVCGVVKRGDRLVTCGEHPGIARAVTASEEYDWRHVIGRALEDKEDAEPMLVEIVVGVK